MIRIILTLILFCSVAQAQPVNPPPSLPITLQNGGTELSNIMTTVTSSGAINNQAIASSKLKFTLATSLTGLVSAAKAQEVLIYNATGAALTIAHESASSTAANRINTPTSTNYSLPNLSGLYLWYDTVSSRWRFQGEAITATSPLVKSVTGALSMPAASGSVNGYLTSTLYNLIIAGLQWAATGNHVYNANSESILLVRYNCSDLVTYATCAAQVATGCTVVNGGDCADFDGNEAGCNAEPQCSWSDPTCSGSYFTSCTGVYRAADNSGAKLQINSATSCNGTAAACSSLTPGSNCSDQDGCTSNANTCSSFIDETDCGNGGCSWNAEVDCATAPLTTQSACEGQGAECTATMTGDCADYNFDEASCNNYSPDCSWDGIDTCSGTYITACTGTIPAYCSGDNSSCTGTATQCSSVVGSTNCTDQDGCTYGVAPAIRAQGDNITTSDGYLEFEKTSAGAPTSGDCDSDTERGRFQLDISNNRLYLCNGATRGWDYTDLTD